MQWHESQDEFQYLSIFYYFYLYGFYAILYHLCFNKVCKRISRRHFTNSFYFSKNLAYTVVKLNNINYQGNVLKHAIPRFTNLPGIICCSCYCCSSIRKEKRKNKPCCKLNNARTNIYTYWTFSLLKYLNYFNSY